MAGGPALADVVVFDVSGSDTVLDVPKTALPGAGTYRFDFESSGPLYVWLAAGFTHHWDIFVAPPPTPHSEALEGSDYPVEDGFEDVTAAFSWTFVVPETSYTYFNAGTEYLDRGVAEGTPLYEIVQYENPFFFFFAQDLAGATFDYAFTVTKLTPGGPSGTPEPGSWALMLLGFGALGGALRRRRAVAA